MRTDPSVVQRSTDGRVLLQHQWFRTRAEVPPFRQSMTWTENLNLSRSGFTAKVKSASDGDVPASTWVQTMLQDFPAFS